MATAAPVPVVLLHAAGLTPQMWQPQVEALGADARVLAPWLAGLRPGRPAELSLTAAADDVVALLDRNGIEQAGLVGHQLGAMVALQVAVTQPGRVARLVLSGAMGTPGKLAMRMQKALIRMLPKQALADSGATKADLLRVLDLVAAADLGSAARISCPVLLVAGSNDPGLAGARQLAGQLPNARLEVLPGVGTDPNAAAPQAYNQLLIDFLSGTED